MNDFKNYNIGFRQGLNEARYADNILEINTPNIDYSDFSSMGYNDGIEYGKYLIQVGMKYDVKEENIIAVIDKGFARALEKYEVEKGRTK